MLGLLKQHNYRLQCNLTTGEFYMLALLQKKTADHSLIGERSFI